MKDITKNLLLAILVLVGVGCSQNISPAKRYAKTWEDTSYEARMKSNNAYSLGNAKEALKDARKDVKEIEKSKRALEKIIKIRTKITEIK